MSSKQMAIVTPGSAEPARAHQPGQDTFKATLPEEVHWQPYPAFPPSARLAIVVGQPTQAGP